MKKPDHPGKQMRKDGKMRMRSHKTRVHPEEPRIQHRPDSGDIDARIIGKGMVSMHQQHNRYQQGKNAHIADADCPAEHSMAWRRRSSKRGRTQLNNLSRKKIRASRTING